MEIRKCQFCGCDISHLRRNATICGSKECTKSYRKWRIENKIGKRFCIICGKDISDTPNQRKICDNPECRKELSRKHYAETFKKKVCKRCGKEFFGTEKQVCCEDCSKIRDIKYEELTRPVKCKYCGKIVAYETVKKTAKTNDESFDKVCDECKEKIFVRFSERMKIDNPVFKNGVVEKRSETFHKNYLKKCEEEGRIPYHKADYKGETKEEMILRMKTNNPMQKQEIRDKVAKTLKERYENGELRKYIGKDNWNWKGNRPFNKAVRIALRRWVKREMESKNFTCQICGKIKTELHVHHLEPLREIITKFLEKLKIDIDYINNIEGTEEYFSIINQIVDYHYENENIGIVVCPSFHNVIDKQYKRKTYENKKHQKT